MLRVAASLLAVPVLLVVLLAGAMGLRQGELGSLTNELFELGPLPVVLLVFFVMLLVFVPLLLLASRFLKISLGVSVAVGLLSALLPVLTSSLSVLLDERLRVGYRLERFGESYPWLAMGVVGGMLFWLFAIAGNGGLGQPSKRPR